MSQLFMEDIAGIKFRMIFIYKKQVSLNIKC